MNKLHIFIIGSLLILIAGMSYCQVQTQTQLDIATQNYKAASDSLHVMILENHELLYEKEAYILKEKELNTRIGVTEDEIKEMKKRLKSSIDYITKMEGLVQVDTVYTTDTLYYTIDSIPIIKFDYNDLWLSLSGETILYDKSPQTSIYNIQIPLALQTGLTTNNSIFVKTDNPYVNITSLEGAIVEGKKPTINFRHELQFGIGFQYGLFNKNLDFGPQIGYGFIIEF